MKQLETTKAKRVTIPTRVSRYAVAYYHNQGWQNSYTFYTTPESAIEDFLRNYRNQDKEHLPKFYTVYEVELEIPVITKGD